MSRTIHGTLAVPSRQHPVLDIAHWMDAFPLGDDRSEGGYVSCASCVARTEHARRFAQTKGDLGPSVPVDVFVWSDGRHWDKPWLTKIGGRPWRERGKPWPKDGQGNPLTFLGQVCFVDSLDILPCKLPGEVALIFGTNDRGWVSVADDGSAIEWTSLTLKDRDTHGFDVPRHGALPFEYHGVIHRTVQYTDLDTYGKAFNAAGWKKGGHGTGAIQATSIGAYANLPQGWPFDDEDRKSLICTLSSFSLEGLWPLVDLPRAPSPVDAEGKERDRWSNRDALRFQVGDVGCMWISRNAEGAFSLDEAYL